MAFRDRRPHLLKNNHWVGIRLVGGPKSPRDAIGAKVFLTSGGVRQRADVFSGGSYGSSSDQRLHFGLGQVMKVDKIGRPSGTKEAFAGSSTDRIITAVEGKGFTDK